MEDIMKFLFKLLLLFLLSSQLAAQDAFKLHFNKFNGSIPMISLAVKPSQLNKFEFILSYVSSILKVEESLLKNNDEYSGVQVAFNFRF